MEKRLTSIEVLKGLGVIYLIALHEWVWVFLDLSMFQFRYEQMQGVFRSFGYFGLHVLGMEVPLLAGVTYFLSLYKKKTKFFVVFQRALVLLILGYTINFVCWGIHGIPDWDVLHFISISMLISFPILRFLPNGLNVIILNIIGCIALSLSNQFPLSQYSGNYLYEIVIGSQSGSHFWPFCPWFFIFSFGTLIGFLFNRNDQKLFQSLFILGLVFVVSAIITGSYHPDMRMDLWGPGIFKPSVFSVLAVVGTSILLILSLEWCFKTFPKIQQSLQKSFIILFGRSILWLYLFNTIVGYHVTHWILNNYEFTFKQAILVYLGLVFGTLIVGYVLAFAVAQKREVSYG